MIFNSCLQDCLPRLVLPRNTSEGPHSHKAWDPDVTTLTLRCAVSDGASSDFILTPGKGMPKLSLLLIRSEESTQCLKYSSGTTIVTPNNDTLQPNVVSRGAFWSAMQRQLRAHD